jgi:RNA polymerase sigma factor (sigma-70 family)
MQMARPRMNNVAARASRSIDPTSDFTATDGGLLTHFIQTRDETAFAELVRRLGPMVLGVCRRITGDSHLAEDAFQAAFIVLARRASDIRPREGLRGWLHGVAVRTAKRARAVSIHRRAHEVDVPSLPDRPAELMEPTDTDALRILDEEVGALPDRLRIAVVLCELEGQSRKDVAGKLGIAEGTLSSRLAAARKRLAARLRQRGVVLTATALTAALAQLASAQPSVALIARAALAATGETVPASVAVLSQGVLRIMFLNKLKSTIPLALLVAGLLACVTVAAVPPPTPPAPPRDLATTPVILAARHTDPPPAKVEPKPLPKGPNKLLFYQAGFLATIDPDGKNETKLNEERADYIKSRYARLNRATLRLSPDGKYLAFLVRTEGFEKQPLILNPKCKLHVRELAEKGLGTDLDVICESFAWSGDGGKIAVTDWTEEPDKQRLMVHHLVDVKTKEKKPLKLPDNHVIRDWTRDGKYLLTNSTVMKDDKRINRIHLMNLDGTEHKALTDETAYASGGRISPDGTRVLCTIPSPKEKQTPLRSDLYVLHIDTGKLTPVADIAVNGSLVGSCWSQDGKQIAYVWQERYIAKADDKPEDLFNRSVECHLMICDEDGKNHKSLSFTKSIPGAAVMGGVDWR